MKDTAPSTCLPCTHPHSFTYVYVALDRHLYPMPKQDTLHTHRHTHTRTNMLFAIFIMNTTCVIFFAPAFVILLLFLYMQFAFFYSFSSFFSCFSFSSCFCLVFVLFFNLLEDIMLGMLAGCGAPAFLFVTQISVLQFFAFDMLRASELAKPKPKPNPNLNCNALRASQHSQTKPTVMSHVCVCV